MCIRFDTKEGRLAKQYGGKQAFFGINNFPPHKVMGGRSCLQSVLYNSK